MRARVRARTCTRTHTHGHRWDPTTGFGSVDYAGFEKAFTSDLDQAQVQAAKQRLQAKAMAKARVAAAAK